MNRLFTYLAVVLFSCVASPILLAQEQDFISDEGEVVEGEFLISKELEITLPTAQRIFQKVPPDEADKRQTEPLTYSFMSYTPQLTDIRTRLRVLKLKDEKISTTGPSSYLNLGFGNFVTPYIEAGLNSGVNQTGNYGLKIHHLSSRNGPVDDQNSGDSQSSIQLFGKYVGGKASLGGGLTYQRRGLHFYGYDPGTDVERDTIQQAFDDIKLDFDITSNDTEAPVGYGLKGEIYSISDKFNASEFGVRFGIVSDYAINDEMAAGLDLDILYNGYKNPEQINRTLVRVHPSFIYTNFGLTLDIGLNVLNHNDTLNNKSNTRIFPDIKASYELTDDITAYGILEGDVEEVTFRSLSYENPFLNAGVPVNHSIKNLDLQVGVRGNLAQYLAFDVAIRSAIYKNLYFYVNDPTDMSKFTILYDEGNTSLFQGILSLSYYKGTTLGTSLSTRFSGYSTGDLEKAWHRPNLEFEYSIWYNLYDKVKFTADLFAISGIEAPDFSMAGVGDVPTTNLQGAVDLNLKVDYTISERYGAFVSVNNLLNNEYQLYNRYPIRGLLAMVGLSISF